MIAFQTSTKIRRRTPGTTRTAASPQGLFDSNFHSTRLPRFEPFVLVERTRPPFFLSPILTAPQGVPCGVICLTQVPQKGETVFPLWGLPRFPLSKNVCFNAALFSCFEPSPFFPQFISTSAGAAPMPVCSYGSRLGA